MEMGAIIGDGCPACRMNQIPVPGGETSSVYMLGMAHGTHPQRVTELLERLCARHKQRFQTMLVIQY